MKQAQKTKQTWTHETTAENNAACEIETTSVSVQNDAVEKTPSAPKSERQAATGGKRYTYLDCLKGITPVPRTPNGAAIFKVLMVGGMVTFMVTVNGIRHTGFEFLLQSHWLYPLMFCIAFLVRTYIGDALVGFLAPRTVLKWFDGAKRGVAMTVLNVFCMAPFMCAFATLLLNGVEGYFISYITTLPIVIPIAIVVNFFIVGPVVKLIFNNHIQPAGGLSMLMNLNEQTASLTRLLGF